MEFEKSFFDREEKNGFVIEPIIKRVWAAQIEIYLELKKLCDEIGVKVYADWGTLLGAARHGGYIPWDDDMDLSMTRADYLLFQAKARDMLPEGFILDSAYTRGFAEEGFNHSTAYFGNGTSFRFTDDFLRKYHGCPIPVGVDIFPLDFLPRDEDNKEIFDSLYTVCFAAGQEVKKRDSGKEYSAEELKIYLDFLSEQLGYNFENNGESSSNELAILLERISALFTREESDYYTHCEYMKAREVPYMLPISAYDESVELDFENIKITVPAGYKEVLAAEYGPDYMTPRQYITPHGYPWFKDQVIQLQNHLKLSTYDDAVQFILNSTGDFN